MARTMEQIRASSRKRQKRYREKNLEKVRKAAREAYYKDPTAARDKKLKLRFNMTETQYQEILKSQNGVCAICKKTETMPHNGSGVPTRLSVDHCHKTKVIRGLLCRACNMGIGYLRDNVDYLYGAIHYLIGTKKAA